MDSVSLRTSHKSQTRQEPTSCKDSEEEDLGDSSSTECSVGEAEKVDSIDRHSSTSSCHRPSGGAKFSQFETPADETRNNFGPEDFDESLFIGQLASSPDHRQFDEELPAIMDTADHSESSDVEEIFVSQDKSCPLDDSSFPQSPTSLEQSKSHRTRSPVGGSSSRKKRHERKPHLLLKREDQEFDQAALERLHEGDLSCDNALDTESTESHHHIPVCVDLIDDDEEDEVQEMEQSGRSSASTEGLKSSPVVRPFYNSCPKIKQCFQKH